MKNRSRKHHYLPRHYLSGFADSDGGFFVYDKQSDSVFPSAPNDTFFENDLNTVILRSGTKSDFLEALYAGTEGIAWESFDRIRASGWDAPVALLDKMNLFLFLSFLHWRLPSNTRHAEDLSQRFFGADNRMSYFTLINKQTGASVPKHIMEEIRTSPAWKKTAKSVIPFAPFFQGNAWLTDLENWRFVYSGDDKNWYIVGDNPLVTRGHDDHDPVACLKEFIFPVSGRVVLVSSAPHIQRLLPPAFALEFATAILDRAQRFVACQDKSFLESVVKYYKFHLCFGKTHIIIPELFDMLAQAEQQSGPT